MSNFLSLQYFLPELCLLIFALLIIVFELIPSLKKHTFNLSVVGLIITSLLLLQSHGENAPLFLGMITIDPFSHFFKYIFLISTLLVIVISRFTKELDSIYFSEYLALLYIMLFGLFLMSSSINLLMIILSIETVSIASYILAGILKYDKKSNESSLKYVIFGAFATGIMLYGMSWLYGFSGSLNFYQINDALQNLEDPFIVYMAIVMILAGIGYKIAMAPFHYWSPDVYEGAPTTMTAYFSVAPKAAGFALMARFFYISFTDYSSGIPIGVSSVDWMTIVAILAAATMTIGNILALRQKNVKRMLAYSSIAHAGYMLMALCVATESALISVMFYLFTYLFMNLGAFFILIYANNTMNVETIKDFNGFGKKSPLLSACMVLFLLSLTGLPPTSGFIAKFYLFAAMIEAQKFYWLAVIAILNTVVSLFYYFSIAKSMYLDKIENDEKLESNSVFTAIVLICALPTAFLIINWSSLYNYIASSILSGIGQ